LWNWWDPAKPGFNPANRENVEWTGWSPDDAVKIAWRNWGQQIRVLPPPNFASPRYTAACREEIRRLVPVVLGWHERLPADKKHLLVGLKLGHETSIGVSAYHYPGGNELLSQPATNDPAQGLKNNDVLARGVAQIGYAALKTSGLRTNGMPTESELRDVARCYLEMLCREAAAWRNALSNTLSDPRCRYVCIFNWESIRSSEAVLKAVSELVEASVQGDHRPVK
jgi:hypothetical protein